MNNSMVSYVIAAFLAGLFIMSMLIYKEMRQPSTSETIDGKAIKVSNTETPPDLGRPQDMISLDRERITKTLEQEYARVESTRSIRIVKDENGQAKGITTDNIESYETARTLGLENGDVLVSLNNEFVDSEDRMIEILKKYRNAQMFRVGIERNGQRVYLTYRIK